MRQTPRSTFNECGMCGVSELAWADLTFITVWKTSARSFLLIFFSHRLGLQERRGTTNLAVGVFWSGFLRDATVTEWVSCCVPLILDFDSSRKLPVGWKWMNAASRWASCLMLHYWPFKKKFDSARNKVISQDHSSDFEIFSDATLQSLLPLKTGESWGVLCPYGFASRNHIKPANSYSGLRV